ncbi:hypothetical protein [Micromonospora chalcea]|uniref:hypothetical protein n=1 Tax=Micromonospora chalcea TaxID=1874 RepID=UPI003325775D
MADELLAAYDTQLRAWTPPALGPLGVVFEQDGPVVRAHFGTHGTVDHRDLPGAGLGALIRRQQEAFAASGEPVEWKVHAYDPPQLAEHLVAARFTPGWERHVLVAPIDSLPSAPFPLPVGQRVREVTFGEHPLLARVQAMAPARTGRRWRSRRRTATPSAGAETWRCENSTDGLWQPAGPSSSTAPSSSPSAA